jgi:hypothetical protein
MTLRNKIGSRERHGLPGTPGADPSERNYRTGLVPRVFSEETHVAI